MTVATAVHAGTSIAPLGGVDDGAHACLPADVEWALAGGDGDDDVFNGRWGDAPEPAWVADAYRAALRDDLAAAASGPIGRGALSLLWLLDPERLATTARRGGVGARRRTGSDVTARGGVDDPTGDDPAGAGDGAGDGLVGAQRAAGMLLDGVVVAQRLINHVHAIQQRLIAAFCRPGVAVPAAGLVDLAGNDLADPLSDPIRAAVARQEAVAAASAEIGCALRLAPVTARMRCENALDLVDRYPATMAGQHAGDIEPYRARMIAESLAVLPTGLRPVVEQRITPAAATHTTAALKRLIGREIIAADPTAAQRRIEQAKAGRTVYTRRGDHDTGILTAVVSAADAQLASAVLDAIADRLATDHLVTDGEADRLTGGRSHAQLRADAFTDLFRALATTGHVTITGGPAGCHRPGGPTRPEEAVSGAVWCGADLPAGRPGTVAAYRRPVALNVYLDAATLAGLDDLPGELAGHGAITAATARALAASADTIRAVITRPAGPDRSCGTTLDAGRAVYRPPDATADYITTRDKTCTFPGCRTTARRCDLDHRHPYDQGGDTCPGNMDTLCRTHHRLKTFTPWTAHPDPDTGQLTWTSPLDRHYPTEQAHLLHDHPPGREPGSTLFAHAPTAANPHPDLPDDPPPF